MNAEIARRTYAERFWRKVQRGHWRTCWPWLGSRTKRGDYGQFGSGTAGRSIKAHRVAYILTYGPPPPDKPHVLHSCDFGLCCNPRHLRAGTHPENMADKVKRGRTSKGERHGNAKLTAPDVRAIRHRKSQGESAATIAADYHIAARTVNQIYSGETWKHVRP